MSDGPIHDLPEPLQTAIEAVTQGVGMGSIARATEALSGRYRQTDRGFDTPLVSSDVQRLAYLSTRLPATYQAVRLVLSELALRAPTLLPQSLLDLGAGPGTAGWAAMNVFPSLQSATLVERDPEFLRLGQTLMRGATNAALTNAGWLQQDLTSRHEWPAHDLVILSYSFGEIDPQRAEQVLKSSWQAARQALVVIEPGTPRGYETILRARQTLSEWGGHLVAPCPHAEKCPMQGTRDWCHFAARVNRSSVHRRAKSAELGHEDEKYSYVVMTKGFGDPVVDRVVRHPQVRSGHVHLELCTRSSGLQKVIISKKQGDRYRWARKVRWGEGAGIKTVDGSQ